MEQEWISLREFMRRNHIGYETAMKLINSGKVEYQKLDEKYKIKVTKNAQVDELTEKLIRRNEELETTLKSAVKIIESVLSLERR